MFEMKILPLLIVGLEGNLGVHLVLWNLSSNVLWSNLVMRDDLVVLNFTSVIGFSLLKIVVLLLSGMEALNFMVGKGVANSSL